MTGGRSARPRALPALTAGLGTFGASGVVLVGVSLTGRSIRLTREASVVAGLLGWAAIAVSAVWLIARFKIWGGVGGPWWTRLHVESDHLAQTIDHIDRAGAAREAWARAGLATARALAADNIVLCRRMDRMALRRSRWWTATGSPAAAEDDPITPMWASLTDGRSRLVELSRELRSQLGRHLAAKPVAGEVPDLIPVDELIRVTDRLRALDAARLEVEEVGESRSGPATPAPPATPTTWNDIADTVAKLVAAKAPDEADAVRRACTQATAAFDAIDAATAQIETDIADFPSEATARSRLQFETPRRSRLGELARRSDELWVAATELLGAAASLRPLTAAPRRPLPEVERSAVSAAEGMIAALREAGAQTDETFPPAGEDLPKPRRRRTSGRPNGGHNGPVP